MRARLFVDRIEEEIAILISADHDAEIAVPCGLLPGDIAEGDWLAATFERDEEMRKQARSGIDDLMAQLGDNP